MTTLTRRVHFTGPIQIVPGLLLTLSIALVAIVLAQRPLFSSIGLSALTLAIVGGMLLGNTLYPRLTCQCGAGVGFSKARLLRLGIVLYGFKLTFQDIYAVGLDGLLIDVLVIASTFTLAWWVGHRKMGLDEQSTMLIGIGSSICGAAAVLAAEPVVRARADQVAVAVATVVVFGTLGMFLYPVLYALVQPWGLSESAYGIWTGSTVHEVAQVVAAGRAVGELAATNAVIIKMLRVMLLAPFLIALAAWLAHRRGASGHPDGHASLHAIPWFAVAFIAVAGFNSLRWLPAQLVQNLLVLDNLILTMAMAALGLTTHISAIRQAGARPLLLAAMLFIWLLLGGALINGLVTGLL
ncbi:YeiH family protein [Castellaniella sp.]|uniref:YeiH family protein n=1 Tax=Castellaniella sp. TaxID=1955812 RepID=UPI00355F6D7D